MTLRELLTGSDALFLRGNEDREVKGITADSGKVAPGTVFFCIQGMARDGADYAKEAVERGAVAMIAGIESDVTPGRTGTMPDSEPWMHDDRLQMLLENAGENVAVVCVRNVRKALARASDAWNGHPSGKLVTIGVTGTKGKTTTTYLIKSILENAGRRVGLIGTNEVIIGRRHLAAGNTTPDATLLHDYFRQMVEEGADTVVMEVSSQAIKHSRTDGILFDYGIFTNLSPDHVAPGEHRDFEEYLECKRELFRQCRIGIINGDDPYAQRITEGCTCKIETYGLNEENELRARNVTLERFDGKLGVRFQTAGLMEFEARIPMPGSFSVYNALAAIYLCKHFRVRESDAQRSLAAAKVKGRIETVLEKDGYVVLIDYAHNPMALSSLLETLRAYHPGRLICLFGCGGDRPVMRRRLMGRISGEKADLTIVTDDNPRSEDAATIRKQIAEGIREVQGSYVMVPGRREAIRQALSMAKEGDLIVLAGKGHETYQEIKGKTYPLDERDIIREIVDKTCYMQTS